MKTLHLQSLFTLLCVGQVHSAVVRTSLTSGDCTKTAINLHSSAAFEATTSAAIAVTLKGERSSSITLPGEKSSSLPAIDGKSFHVPVIGGKSFPALLISGKSSSITSRGGKSSSANLLKGEKGASTSMTTVSATTSTSTSSGNTASDRSIWGDYDLSTDYYNVVPDTGITREYWFDLIQTTASPDGYERMVLTVNGTVPGPTIFADWGDTIVVHVTNNLNISENGTSIHFHGIRQNQTNQMDGVVSITQCPTAPGSSLTYTWRATQYGSSWYHSHFALQAWEGVFGGIVINGPASSDYDEDLGILFLNDWTHSTADELWAYAQKVGPPTLDNGLINGTNVYGEDGASNQTGSRYEVSVESGTSYRFRIVNGAIDTHFKFMIDNHTMTVIANDLVPIIPYETTVLNIGMGQRYDIVVTMAQESVASDFWLRAIPQAACSDNDSTENIRGIIHYGTSTSTPTTSYYSFTDECIDEDMSDLVPYLAVNGVTSYWSKSEGVAVAANSDNLFRWYLNNVSMEVNWDNPTLLQIYNGNDSWTNTSNVIELSETDEWAYIIIETDAAVPHPIHLHGHDFLILAQGTGTFNTSATLNLTNPPRRDVAMLYESGHLVIAFKTDNPGAWLAHCHIGWHTSEGFDFQFVERYNDIADLVDYDTLNSNCEAWNTYASAESIEEEDSGV